MLSMTGVSSTGIAFLGCKRVGVVTGLYPISGVHELIIFTLTFSLVCKV